MRVLLAGLLIGLIALLYYCRQVTERPRQVFDSAEQSFSIDTLATGLKIPFGMDWISGSRMIFTERGKTDSNLCVLNTNSGTVTPICNVPAVYSDGDAGMLDILVHPDFKKNEWIYFAYATIDADSLSTLVIERAKLKSNCLEERQQLFQAKPRFKSNGHIGCRMQLKDGYLFFSMGERFNARDSAQTLTNHFGKIIRLHDDGRIPADNPFAGRADALPEIWSYGHRNPQGMAFHPETGELWIHEHGPQGGDEINIVKKGKNYGWPIVTYGEEYGGGKIGEGLTQKPGMESPIYYYVPSIAPCGMMFYSGDRFPKWRNNIFSGALALRHINRLVVENNKVTQEERILSRQSWRIRNVKQGPDGFIYVATDKGMVLRLKPA